MSKKGFTLIEIILALAVVMLILTAVFDFVVTLYFQVNDSFTHEDEYFSYNYGRTYCVRTKEIHDIFVSSDSVLLSPFISTSTKVTSIHSLGSELFIITTDSSSTTEPDILLFSISTSTHAINIIHTVDIGPGVQDSVLLDNFLYIANTSVNSHVKSLYVDIVATGTEVFKEWSSIRIDTLSQSFSNPKKISIYNHNLILGSEKSNTGAEIFVIPIEQDGVGRFVATSSELGGQAHQAASVYSHLYVANAADPELRIFDRSFKNISSYDAPLTLGNGKSVLYMYPYTLLGRTFGSSELTLLHLLGTTTSVMDTDRTYGTVDFLEKLESTTDTSLKFISIISHEDKELQFWSIENNQLILDGMLDLPGRATAYTCNLNTLYVFTTSNNQTTLSWIHL